MKHVLWSCLAAVLSLASRTTSSAADSVVVGSQELRTQFQTPPSSARPWVYWFIMDGNFSREGITADLEAIQRVGLGGVILMEVDLGIPRGPVRFMSPEWQELFRHAVREAQRFGLQITLNAGPGWTGSGGPWVAPEQSMQHLVASETNVTGPMHFEALLPRPFPRKPFFGEGALPPDQEKARKEFYRDVVVLAFPTPAGNSRIADVDEKALYLRAPFSSQPGVKPFLPAQADYTILPEKECVATNQIVDLTQRLSPDGRLDWQVPPGQWTVLRFGRTTTGQNTRPAPAPGLGLESDKFDPAALDAHFQTFVGTLLRGLNPTQTNGAGWTMLHIDSWEMSSQNWSPKFREEFRKRRGYDLLPYLPVLTGRVVGSLEISERFLWDLRQTAQELVLLNHALHLKELGREHGFGLSMEPYDMNPCADVTLGSAADVPMCEFWAKGFGFRTEFSCFEAASIAHTLGKPVVAAESFTSDGERWVLHPGAMKGQGDWAFCTGINRLVFHRYQHQPWLDRWPGLTMGSIGSHWERTQTWWELAPAYHQYLARCQFLLRLGKPVADICYLVPEGAPHVFSPPPSATRGDPPDHLEFNFDACAPDVVQSQASLQDGRLALKSGASYAVLVLPDFATMTPELLGRIQHLVQDGATVIGLPPRKSPSLSAYPKCDEEVKRMVAGLWGDSVAGSERQVGKGRVIGVPRSTSEPNAGAEIYPAYDIVRAALKSKGVLPDFEAEAPLRYAHRQDGGTDLYFVANPSGSAVITRAWFRVAGRVPELWDPIGGEQRLLPQYTTEGGRTVIPLALEPYQSFFIVFPERSELKRSTPVNFPQATLLSEIGGPWKVQFQSNRGAPESVELQTLVDWAKHPNPGVRHFSGIARYEARFIWQPQSQASSPGDRIYLDLGNVQVMANVRLNGHDLGTVWTSPFRVDASAALQSGPNTLQVRVANLWCNRLIADSGLPQEQRLTWTTWNPFTPDTPLISSGLLGPVRFLVKRQSPRDSDREGE